MLLWELTPSTANDVRGIDLHLVTTSPGGDPPSNDRLLAQGVTNFRLDAQPDSRGRLAVGIAVPDATPSFAYDLVLVDTNIGQNLDLGLASFYVRSPSNDRLMYEIAVDGGHVMRLHEIDDQDLALSSGDQSGTGQFLGEDLYYSIGPDLWRIKPGGVPAHLASGLASFSVVGPFISITRVGPTGGVPTLSVLDPTTDQESVVAGATSALSVSPDGRWIATVANPILADPTGADPTGAGRTAKVIVFEPATGATHAYDLPIQYAPDVEWRPGAENELWIWSGQFTAVLTPGTPALELRHSLFPVLDLSSSQEPLTRDGASFFSFGLDVVPTYSETSPVYLVPVNAPTSAGVRLNPEGSSLVFASDVPGGRLLVGVAYGDTDRLDLLLVDRATGASRLLGEAGSVVAVGERRLLATLHRTDGAGDLTLVDFDTGASTTLAESVTSVAVEGSTGSDALASGTRVAYVLLNSIASPYDGAWLVTLP